MPMNPFGQGAPISFGGEAAFDFYSSRLATDYGVIADGTTDDTAAMQAWLDAGGGFMPAGTILVTSTLTYADNTVIEGQGMAATTISYTGTGFCIDSRTPTVRTFGLQASLFRLEYAVGADGGIHLQRMSDGHIHEVEIVALTVADGDAILADGAAATVQRNVIEQCVLTDALNGVNFQAGVDGIDVYDCTINNCTSACRVTDSLNVQLVSNVMTNGTNGVRLTATVSALADGCVVSNNSFAGNTNNVRVAGVAANVRGIIVIGNFHADGIQHLSVADSTRPSIIGDSSPTADTISLLSGKLTVSADAQTDDPDQGDDTADGFGVGARWVNTTWAGGQGFTLADATEAAAVWMCDSKPQLAGVALNGLVFAASAVDLNSYPGSGTSVRNITPGIQTSQLGVFSGNTTFANGGWVFDGASGSITFTVEDEVDNVFAGVGTVSSWQNVLSDGEGNLGRILAKAGNFGGAGWYTLATGAGGIGAFPDTRLTVERATTDAVFEVDMAGEFVVYGTTFLQQWTYDTDNPDTPATCRINGVPRTVTVVAVGSGAPVSDVGHPLRFGNRGNDDNTLDGTIFGVYLHNRALSDAEAAAMYAAGAPEFVASTRTNFLGDVLVAGDFALSAGWGATGAVTAAGGTDSAGFLEITAAGAGLATNATITLTFADGRWPIAPLALLQRNDVAAPLGSATDITYTTTATTLVITFSGLPVAANVYRFEFRNYTSN